MHGIKQRLTDLSKRADVIKVGLVVQARNDDDY